MRARGRTRVTARLSCAAAALLVPCTAFAQQAPPPSDPSVPLDPNAPLDPMPDLDVEWPDMNVDPVQASPEQKVEAVDPAVERRYALAVEGVSGVDDAAAVMAAFDEASTLRKNSKEATNAAQIDRRSRADAALLTELLRSRGYYDAAVEPRIEPRGSDLFVVLNAEPGARYYFSSVELPGLDTAGEEAADLRKTFAVEPGDPVIAKDVIDAGTALQVKLGQTGFASASIGEQQIEVDHTAHTASLVLPVDTGPVARFGQLRVDGQPPFPVSHLQTIARFRAGQRYQRSKVDDLRRALIATGLVASADVKTIPSADRQTVDIAVHLEPAPMRTVAGELGYGTGEGPRLEASWQHRNFFNPEGALTVRGIAGTKEQLAGVEFRRSNFRRRDQTVSLQAAASKVERDAYEARTIQLGGAIERQSNIIWRKKWTYSLGAEVLATDERGVFDDPTTKETRTFFIAALPASLRYDGSNDLLDPTDGFRLGGRISPELSAHGGRFNYARVQLDASAYRPISSGTVVAGRVRLGTILGAQSSQIAPSRRFYSGGGGSVRGYGYQQLGPRDADGDPIGGRGLAEFALEARVRLKAFGGNFGIVPFIDGGTLTGDLVPDFGKWQIGAGIGARYYSSFGPIRVDVGTPLNPRSGDARLAVVVSLGQAF